MESATRVNMEKFGRWSCGNLRIETMSLQVETRRDNVFQKLVNTYRNSLDGQLFMGFGDKLYFAPSPNRKRGDGDAWRCVSKKGKGVYEDLVMERNRQDCLADLGIGVETWHVPSSVKEHIYQKMRPKTSAATTQARVPMAEFETQTRWTGMNSKDMASQAVPDTMDSGIQARPNMADFGTQARPNMAHFGTQVRPNMAHFGTQARPNMAHFGTQARPNVAEFGTQARPMTAEFSTQAGQMGVDVGIQMTPPDQHPQEQSDQYNTIHFDLKNTKYQVKIKSDGKIITLTAEQARVLHGLLMTSVQQTTSESDDLIVGTQAADSSYYDSSQEFDSRNCQGATGTIPKIPHNIERTKRMSQGDTIKFHEDLPYEGQLEHYLSPLSPFPQFGYIPSRDIPITLKDIKIPVVQYHDVIYDKTEDDNVILGRGSFGCVYFAKHCTLTMDLCVKEYEDESTTLYDIQQEAKLLLYLQSTKFVPQCLGLIASPFIHAGVCLVQECFAKGYTLKQLLNDRPRSFTDRKWVATAYQLFWGMKMIHEKQVLLNDIKSDNVLIDYQSEDMTNNIRFIDMGLATFRRGLRFSDDPTYMMGCSDNYAPEVRLGNYSTPASDLYAVGYMVNEISESIGIVELDLIAQMCTEDDPDDRSSCQAVLQKLEDILEEM